MHSSDQPYFPRTPLQPPADPFTHYMQNAPMGPVFNGEFAPPIVEPLMPFHSVNIQPPTDDACPRNLVISDQTNHESHIMFHPEINSTFFYPNFGVNTIFQDNIHQNDSNYEIFKTASPFKEDSDDIDALLSTEIEECEDDDDEMSTARTDAVYECNSLDSCSNYVPPSNNYKDEKRRRIRKMVKALKGIVPGANRMSTVAVFDEAVRYLKSLKMDVQKLGRIDSKV